jgi:hypothetical protein
MGSDETLVLAVVKHDLFSPPFMKLKKEIYKARQKVDATRYACDKFITGLEKVAEAQLPIYIQYHNKLIQELNKKIECLLGEKTK